MIFSKFLTHRALINKFLPYYFGSSTFIQKISESNWKHSEIIIIIVKVHRNGFLTLVYYYNTMYKFLQPFL